MRGEGLRHQGTLTGHAQRAAKAMARKGVQVIIVLSMIISNQRLETDGKGSK
jgi:hypothetical protein